MAFWLDFQQALWGERARGKPSLLVPAASGLGMAKSALLGRLMRGEEIRRRPCPRHKGVMWCYWGSGNLDRANYLCCDTTGWLRNETDEAARRSAAVLRREFPLFILGEPYPCRLCRGPIPPGEPVLCLPYAPLPPGDPLAPFDALACHPACWESWPLRPQFIERFNRLGKDAVLHPDGSVAFLRADGSVDEQQSRIYIVPGTGA